MANIRVTVNYTIKDGSEIGFRSPVDCSAITGLVVYYVAEDGTASSKEFVLADAHGHNIGDIDHLFAENVVVKVILDVTHGMAFVQNADTNAYIEKTFVKSVNGNKPDKNGDVKVAVCDLLVDSTLSIPGQAADAAVTGKVKGIALYASQRAEDAQSRADEAYELAKQGGGGLTPVASALLIQILRHATYDDSADQTANITALEKALASNTGGGDEPDIPDEPDEPIDPEATLVSITASYSGGDVAIGTALSALTGISVMAVYSDGSTATVTDYTLTGEIAEGDNIITVTYEGKTAIFVVVGYDAALQVIDLAPYLKAENKQLTTFYQGNTIRWGDVNGHNIYCVPVEAGIYRMSAVISTTYQSNGFCIQNSNGDKIIVNKLPLLAQDTDLSTNSISYVEAASCTHVWSGSQGNYISTLTIEFASAGYFLFSIKPSENVTFAKVVA